MQDVGRDKPHQSQVNLFLNIPVPFPSLRLSVLLAVDVLSVYSFAALSSLSPPGSPAPNLPHLFESWVSEDITQEEVKRMNGALDYGVHSCFD